MEEKCCVICGEIKEIILFKTESRNKSGRGNKCKTCDTKQSCIRQKKNAEKVLEKNRKWVRSNPDKVRIHREKRKPKANAIKRKRYREDPEFRKAIINKVQKYRDDPKNKPVIRAANRKLMRQYRQKAEYRAMFNLRRRFSFLMKDKRSDAHSLKLIGCNKNKLKHHLESQFQDGMSWDNYGLHGWHIDHIKPCAAFDLTDPAQQKECFHYTNLQPLWAKDNLSKGGKFKLP